MKKTITSLAAFALLASAIPAHAQEINLAPTAATVNDSKLPTSAPSQVINPRAKVSWNSVPGAAYYDVYVNNLTTNQLYQYSRQSSLIFESGYLTSGHDYIIVVNALDSNFNKIASGHTQQFKAIYHNLWTIYLS
ncbi:hypothetical protein [Paenibacillus lutrae]|uniref:Fibronectin type-III domain-containing protein n=1 Tax=Paenibacillus lutrae TaxID=2078573 RepID=A0A7X3FIG0_9BACL|nr:hypothetical protein [Paenibacillus lutrae]MVP00283.1 hypothetical protein [Paenibacillus lutrae]